MFAQNEIDNIVKEYTENHSSLAELSKIHNCTSGTIKKLLISNQIKVRSRGEQTKYSNMKRAKTCDDNYFSNIDSVNKAWLLGFLASDGTVRAERNEMKIGLSSIDREILEKIKEELKISRNISDYVTNNGFSVSELIWTSAQQKNDLAKYSIVPNKTYINFHLPHFDNKNYTLAYILGYIDGDGSISVSKENYLRIRIVSYQENILNDIIRFLQENYQITYSLSKNRNIYELSISTQYAKTILKDMYNLGSLHLDRKYQKYLEWKNQETSTSSKDEKIC